jgi:hypothetical protein
MVDPQTLQTAINASTNAHTALHQLIHELKQGSVAEAKQALARLITMLTNILMIL